MTTLLGWRINQPKDSPQNRRELGLRSQPIIVWIAGLAGSVVIIVASMIFVADATTKFLAPAVAATVSAHTPTARLADSATEIVRAPEAIGPAPVVNGPPASAQPVVTAVSVPSPAPAETLSMEEPTGLQHRIVAAPSLNVRAEPSGKAAKVGALQRGAAVTIVEEQGAWSKLTDSHGTDGWVYSKFLEVRRPE